MVSQSDASAARRDECPICGHPVETGYTSNTLDAICPHCGALLWFVESRFIPVAESSREIEDLRPCELPDTFVIHPAVAGLIPKSVAYEHGVIAIAEFSNAILIAGVPPIDNETVEKLRFILNRRVLMVWPDNDWIARRLADHYGTSDDVDAA